MTETKNRRPLTSRDTGWARAATKALAATRVTPNQISLMGAVAAAVAGLCIAGSRWTGGWAEIALLIGGAVFIQMRLLCNLFDGMLAVEAERGGPTGAFWNEVPDRFADLAILVGAGLGAGMPSLGWAAAALAILVAYLRAFGGSLGQPADYGGPMAKQHRMATLTLACLGAALASPWIRPEPVLAIALWIVVAGAAITALRRAARICRLLSGR